MEQVKVDLNYLKPFSSFQYPLYTLSGERAVNEKVILDAKKILELKNLYGPILYYNKPDSTVQGGQLSEIVLSTAMDHARDIMKEISSTDMFTKDSFIKTESIIDDIVSQLEGAEVLALSLLKKMKNHEEYLYQHSVNMGMLSALFAIKKGGFSREQVKNLAIGAYLSDIGQLRIDRQLLKKSGKYDISDMNKMKRHPQLGYEMLNKIPGISPVILQTILFHHEKYNNLGYYGLPYENLQIFPKIVSAADIYDSLTTSRPYRVAQSVSRALKIMVNFSGINFSPEFMSEFINIMAPILNKSQPFYSGDDFVELDTGELAVVLAPGKKELMSPKVKVFSRFVRSGKETRVSLVREPFEVDLQIDKNRKLKKFITDSRHILLIKTKLFKMDGN